MMFADLVQTSIYLKGATRLHSKGTISVQGNPWIARKGKDHNRWTILDFKLKLKFIRMHTNCDAAPLNNYQRCILWAQGWVGKLLFFNLFFNLETTHT